MEKQIKIDEYILENNLLKEKVRLLESLLFPKTIDKLEVVEEIKKAFDIKKAGYWYYNINNKSVNWSDEVYGYFEAEKSQKIDYNFYISHIHPEDRERIIKIFENAIQNNTSYNVEYRIISLSGKTKWLHCTGKVFKNEKGETIIGGSSIEITEAVEIRNRIFEKEDSYRVFFKKNPLPMWIYNPKTLEIIDVNESAILKYGYTKEEFINKTILDISSHEDNKKLTEITAKNKEEKNVSTDGLWRHKTKKGNIIYVEVKLTKINFSDKEFQLAIINDITEKVLAETALKEKNQRYQMLFSRANDAIFIMDNETFIDCNEKTLEMFACKRYEIIGHSPIEFSPEFQPDGRKSKESAIEKITNAVSGKPQKFYWKHIKKNGNPFDAEVSLNAIEINNKIFIQAIVRDISDRVAAEKQVKKLQENLKKQNKVLVDLANNKTVFSGSFIESSKEIIKAAAQTLNITKSSVWLYYPEKNITTVATYYLKNNQFDYTPIVLNFADYQEYFKSIKSERIIAVKDVYNDSRMSAFSETYFKKFNIKSTLDVPVRVGKEIVAIMCNEFEGEHREWTFEEQTFAAGLADLLSIAYEKNQLREAELKIIENEKIIKTVLENIKQITYSFDIDNHGKAKLKFISPQIKDILGLSQEEFIKKLNDKTYQELFHPEDISLIKEAANKLLKEKEVNVIYRIKNIITQQYIWIEENIINIYNKDNKLITRLGILTDITERKKGIDRLKESERRFRLLADAAIEGIVITNNDKIIDVNDRFFLMHGYSSKEEVIGKNIKDFFLPNKSIENINRPIEIESKKKDGETITLELKGEKIPFEDKEIRIAVLYDISERKKYEQVLRESRESYKNLIESLPVGIIILNEELKVKFVNDTGKKLFEIPRNHTEALNIWDFINKNQKKDVLEKILNAFSGNKIIFFELNILTSKNEEKTVEAKGILINYQGEKALLVVLNDITDRKQLQKEHLRAQIAEQTNKRLQKEIANRINAERKLIENQQFTKSIIQSSLDMICATDKQGKIIEFNEAACIKFGYTLEEIKKQSPKVLYADEKQFERVHKQIYNLGNYSGEVINVRKDGSKFVSYLTASQLLSPTGEVIGSMGVSRDITESKEAEKRLKDALKEKEILLKEVHHRVKNNLQLISSILNLQSSYVNDENTINILKECQNRIKSMAFIHESLYQNKNFTKIKFSEYIINLSKNLVQSYKLNNNLIDIKLEIDEVFLNLDESIPCGLIINELVSNALKYAFTNKEQGEIEIKVKNKADKLYLSVADNGKGLPSGFSIENTQTLGLQLVNSLSEQLDAELKLSSNPEQGTRFEIEFKLK